MKHGRFLSRLAARLRCGDAAAFAQLPDDAAHQHFSAGRQARRSGRSDDRRQRTWTTCEKLLFNHPGLTAAPKMTAATALEPATAGRRISSRSRSAADVPPGIYEVRALGRFGLSNPRSFVVGSADRGRSMRRQQRRRTRRSRCRWRRRSTAASRPTPSNILRLNLKKGERVLIEVAARRIDSRLDATLVAARIRAAAS